MAHRLILPVAVLVLLTTLPGSAPAADDRQPATAPTATHQKIIDALGAAGVQHDDVYTVTLPRKDLSVIIDGDEVPVAAGLASVFHFYKGCCGRTMVAGQFCVLDFEANDVIDALREAQIRIGSVSNLFVDDKPKVMVIRFQGDVNLDAMLKSIKEAMTHIGPARAATQPTQ